MIVCPFVVCLLTIVLSVSGIYVETFCTYLFSSIHINMNVLDLIFFILFICCGIWFMVPNATFNIISVISWRSVLLVEETGGYHRPFASHWQTLLHYMVSSTHRLCGIQTYNVSSDTITTAPTFYKLDQIINQSKIIKICNIIWYIFYDINIMYYNKLKTLLFILLSLTLLFIKWQVNILMKQMSVIYKWRNYY